MDANCDNPKRCSYCDSTEGKSLGHNYVNGYCTRCHLKDPSYIDLNNFGFTNMYGMTEWIEIDAYYFSEGYILAGRAISGVAVDMKAYSFKNNYIELKYPRFKNGELSYGSAVKAWAYNNVNNDVANSAFGSIIITDRVVNKTKGYLVLKTSMNGSETWLVPADLLDPSKTSIIEDGIYKYRKVFFKSNVN